MTIGGFHHVTALAGDAQQNLNFYTDSLRMRLVKRTVNYDDPGAHHFYYSDAHGAPGTLLTFFPWGRWRKPRRGAGQAVSITLAGPEDRTILDPDGISLEFVAVKGASGIVGATILESNLNATLSLLGETLALEQVEGTAGRPRFRVAGNQYIDVLHEPGAQPVKMGAGIPHHIALRAGTEESLLQWRARLIAAGLRVSSVRDRHYFHSVYFKHPGGTLFELATDGPGFAIDEPADALGTSLCLPPWLEPHRAEISERLAPVQFPT